MVYKCHRFLRGFYSYLACADGMELLASAEKFVVVSRLMNKSTLQLHM